MLPLEPSLLEEGYVVHFAQRIAAGEHLYRDLVTYTGPLPYEALALLFRAFGEEISVARGAVALLQALACAAVFDLARRAGSGPFAHAAAAAVAVGPVLLFPLMSIFFYSTLAYQLSLLAGWAASRGVRSPGFALAAGALVSLVALCKQTLGLALALGLLAGLAAACPAESRRRRLLALAAGGTGVAALTLGVYAWRGDLEPLARSLVLLPLSLEDSFASPYPNLWPPGELDPEILASQAYYVPQVQHLLLAPGSQPGRASILLAQLLYALPILAIGATIVRGVLGRVSGDAWIHLALLAALATNLYPRADWGHLTVVLPPSLVQLGLLVRGPRARGPGVVLAAVATSGLLALALWVGVGLHRMAGPASFGPRVPQRPVSALYRGPDVPRVIRFLREHTHPNEPIFVARMEPLLYFATDTSNPTPYGGVMPGDRRAQEGAILRGLEDVRFVVMSDVDRPVFNYYRDALPAVQAYLERHFEVSSAFRGVEPLWLLVLERGSDRGETALDLIAASAGARFWMREADGRERPVSGEPPRLATRRNRRPLPMLVGPGGGGVDLEIPVPPGARLQAGVGLRTLAGVSGTVQHADPVDLVVSVADRRQPEEGFVPLASWRLDDGTLGVDWIRLEVDLSAYAGQPVTLRLEAVPLGPRSALGIAWWGSPRILSAP